MTSCLPGGTLALQFPAHNHPGTGSGCYSPASLAHESKVCECGSPLGRVIG